MIKSNMIEKHSTELIRGKCYRCGKVHSDIERDDINWRYTCDKCGSHVIFLGEKYIDRIECISMHVNKCRICNAELEDIGIGDGYGVGFYIYKCKCGDKLIATHY